MKILAIETSCDETACAIVEDGVKELVSVVASSKELHEVTGGVVPEVASRKQMEFMMPVLEKTVEDYRRKMGFESRKQAVDSIDALAVTVGPGLIGSLVVGVTTAKALALAWKKPLIPVNHLVGHIYANFIDNPRKIQFPAVCLLVSGGHTDLVLLKRHGEFEYLGGTLDDAVGECFDKTARLLGISKYLGGALLSKKAEECKENSIVGKLPRPMIREDNYDFSFSGLKTAVKRLVAAEPNLPAETIAREFETAVVEVLVEKTMRAVKEKGVKSLLMGGGVAANKTLRAALEKECEKSGVVFHVPPVRLCTDYAVYIASVAYFEKETVSPVKVKADPSLRIMDKA